LLAAYWDGVYHCANCPRTHTDPSAFDVDARVKSLGHIKGNTWVLCPNCHREKSLANGDMAA
jgi:hypothetical protein